jgi:hypothetical protein
MTLSNIHPGYAGLVVLLTVPIGYLLGDSFIAHFVPSAFIAIYLTTVTITLLVFFSGSLLFNLEG